MTGAPPPRGNVTPHQSWTQSQTVPRAMFRESVRTWAPGWVTAFYLLLWIGLCTQRLLHRWNGMGISVHQLPGRGRNAQLRDMVAWMDYSWYHQRGICWATDTVGAHAAAASLPHSTQATWHFRHAHACASRRHYDAWHWWFIWTVQLYTLHFSSRTLDCRELPSVSCWPAHGTIPPQFHSWHTR